MPSFSRLRRNAAQVRIAPVTIVDEFICALSEPAIRVGMDGRVQAVNQPASDLWGAPESELVERDLEELFGPDGNSGLLDRLREPERGGEKLAAVPKAGALAPVTVWAVRRPAEAVEHLYLIVKPQLAAREGTAAQLDFERFLNLAAHDLNEPLRKIFAFSQQLKRKCADTLNEECKDYLDRMQSAVSRMHVLVEALLTLCRIGRGGVAIQAVSLADAVKKAMEKHELQIVRSKAKVEVAELPRVRSDPALLVNMLSNLIDNALKFNRPGESPVLKIYPGEAQVDGRVALVIEDQGVGIDQKHVERIFQGFQKLHGRDEFDGAGIGLAACRKIANLIDARVLVESDIDKGSKFIVTLPAASG